MKVGITFDLRDYYLKQGYSLEETAEFDRVSTIDGIENALKELNYQVDRIGNFEQLMIKINNKEKWDIVFNICEGLRGYGRESLVPSILDFYKIPYVFSDPLTLSVSLNKAVTKKVLRDSKIATPEFHVVDTVSDIDEVNLKYPLFAKPIAEGTGKGIDSNSKINNKNELKNVCKKLLDTFKQPVLVEEFLPGREFTVGIIGSGISAYSIGVMEVINKVDAENNIYSYDNKENSEENVAYNFLKDETAQKCIDISLKAWRCINAYDGGRIDIRFDGKGNPNILEINPLAGMHYEHSDLPMIARFAGIDYKELIKRIMDESIKRNNLLK